MDKVCSEHSHEWAFVTSCPLGQEIPRGARLQEKYTFNLPKEILIKVLPFF